MRITFKTAKLAKEMGYDNESESYFDVSGELLYDRYFPALQRSKPSMYYDAPSQSLLQKWLREEHNIHVNPIPNITLQSEGYHLGIVYGEKVINTKVIQNEKGYIKRFNKYEEALEAGLQEALKLI